MQKIVFRADGNAQVGAGHVMRCLSIADAARQRGMACIFVTAGDSFADKITSAGFPLRVLGTEYTNMEAELPQLEQVLLKEKPDTLFVDSYYVTKAYLAKLRTYGRVVYMDDVAAFAYPADALVNYNIFGERMGYPAIYARENVPQPTFYLGPAYIPLRKEFQGVPKRHPSDKANRVIVSVGGADPERMALHLLEALEQHPGTAQKYVFDFIVGAFEPDKDALRRAAEKYTWLVLHENVSRMSDIMLRCDMAISAAGSTLYELCACGVPTITYALADNQIPGADAFAQQRLMCSLGDVRENEHFCSDLIASLETLSANAELRRELSERQQKMVDGRGAFRLIEELDKKTSF